VADFLSAVHTDELGAADIAAHGVDVAVAAVLHDGLVARAALVGVGDEACPEPVQRQPLQARGLDPGQCQSPRQDLRQGIGMQRGGLDASPTVDLPKMGQLSLRLQNLTYGV
jgi:hypothetical protein